MNQTKSHLAYKSKDPRTKIGAVLVRDRHDLISGYNGPPEGRSMQLIVFIVYIF